VIGSQVMADPSDMSYFKSLTPIVFPTFASLSPRQSRPIMIARKKPTG
jgi:hypothetical protein